MIKTRFLVAWIIVVLVSLVGCGGGGGGGGGSAPVAFEKDVAGITATLDKFAAALKSGDISSSGLFAQTNDPAQTTKILYVNDFGVDLSSSADNTRWEFIVNPADINQTAPDVAIVKASKVMSSGSTLWLIFHMVKDEGAWMIEGIDVEESATTKSFITRNYFPVTPGSKMKYLVPGTIPSYYTEEVFVTDTFQVNGMILYKFYSDRDAALLPASWRAQIFDNRDVFIGYNNAGELWAYSPYVNDAQPYRLMKTAYGLGEKEVIREVTEGRTIITTITVGSQTQLVTTPLRTFEAMPVIQQSNYISSEQNATETSIIFFADGIGIVRVDNIDSANPTSYSSDLLFERYINGSYDRNLPVISSPATAQDVVIGQSMVPVGFSATGGSAPITWAIENAPTGLTIVPIGPSTASLQGLPEPSEKVWYINVIATDIYGRRGVKQYDLAVVKAPPLTVTSNNALLNGSLIHTVYIGHTIDTVVFSASNNSGPVTVTEWSISGTLPAGISFNTISGALSGTDASSVPASFPVIINAVDAIGGVGSIEITISVEKAPPLTVTSNNALLNGSLIHTVYIGHTMDTVVFSASNNSGPVTVAEWSISGSLPSGINFNTVSGALSGTDASSVPGSYPVIINAVDAIGGVGSMQIVVSVEKAPPLTITCDAAILEQSVVLGQNMINVTFSATGHTHDVNWSISGSPSVPFNIGIGSGGILSGSVVASTVPGDYVITVTAIATDGSGDSGSLNYTLRVIPGTYFMPQYYPIVPGDEYTYAMTDNTDAVVPVRMQSTLTSIANPVVVGGETVNFYEHLIAYPTVPGFATSVRASARALPRRSVRAQTTPTAPAILYYRGLDSIGNVWERGPDINSGVPYKIFNAWTNPGETSQFTLNFSDGYTWTYNVKIGSNLISSVVTPLGTFSNVMSITYLVNITDAGGVPSTLNYIEYCAKDVGVIATHYYDDPALNILIDKELLLTTMHGGVLTANNPQISTTDLTVASNFSFALHATGGSSDYPYKWTVAPLYVGTQMREQSGVTYFEGTLAPTTYNFTLTVTDHYYRSATKPIVMTVQ